MAVGKNIAFLADSKQSCALGTICLRKPIAIQLAAVPITRDRRFSFPFVLGEGFARCESGGACRIHS